MKNKGRMAVSGLLFVCFMLISIRNVGFCAEEERDENLTVVFMHDLHSYLDSFTTRIDGEEVEAGGNLEGNIFPVVITRKSVEEDQFDT